MVKIKASVAQYSFQEDMENNLFPFLVQLLEAACLLWLMAPLHLQSQQRWAESFSLHYSDLLFCLPRALLRTLWLHQPTQIMQDSSIRKIHSPLLWNVTYLQVLGIRMWRLVWGCVHYFASYERYCIMEKCMGFNIRWVYTSISE